MLHGFAKLKIDRSRYQFSSVLVERDKDSQFALLSVKIYRADGLPTFNRCLMSQIKKRCSMENGIFIDPYVQVFFAGLK
ncbi:hypothetical protein TNCT_100111, partial [Trichonephila clavata]